MVFKNIHLTLLAVLLFLVLIQIIFAQNEQPPKPTASVSENKVFMGNTFIMKCEMPSNFDMGKENSFYMDFFVNIQNILHEDIARFTIPATTADLNEKVFDSFLSDADKLYILSVHPKTTSNKNVFEISISTTKKLYNAQFYCQAYWNLQLSNHSNVVAVSTVQLPPAPTISSNVNQIQVNKPFALTCSLVATFKTSDFYNQVDFFNSRDGLLAEYKIDTNKHVTFKSNNHEKVSTHDGTEKKFPTFSIVVQEKADRKLNYWCKLSLVDPNNLNNKYVVESNHWKSVGLFVNYFW